MDDAPKSALELAMARLKKQDAEQGVSERFLTEDQKNEIAEVRKTYGAKLAQEEILFKSKTRVYMEPDTRREVEDALPPRRRAPQSRAGSEDREDPRREVARRPSDAIAQTVNAQPAPSR